MNTREHLRRAAQDRDEARTKLFKSETQVRELRERERFAVQLLRQILYPSPDDITDGRSIRLAAEKLIMENHQRNVAALRSAPPSGQVVFDPNCPSCHGTGLVACSGYDDSPAQRQCGCHYEYTARLKQAPYDKTDAWDERQDLAAKGPAAPDGFTGPRKVGETVQGSSTADKSVEYSGRQDSPSRSRPRPKPCETCRGRGEILTQGPCYMGCYVCGGSGYPPCPQCGSKFHIECAPPSPAREKENDD